MIETLYGVGYRFKEGLSAAEAVPELMSLAGRTA